MANSSASNKKRLLHILLIVIPYLILEIILNVSLVEAYGKASKNLVDANYSNQLHNLELLGRYITGFGLAYIFSPFLFKLLPFLPEDSSKLTVKKFFGMLGKNTSKLTIFVLVWLLIATSLKVIVESYVHSSTPQVKFSSVRAILFKELYATGQMEIENLDVFNNALKDPDSKKVVTALIPSLTFVSKDIDNKIANVMYPYLAGLQEDYRVESYIREVEPLREEIKQYIDSQYDLFVDYRKKLVAIEDQRKLINPKVDEILFFAKNQKLSLWHEMQQDLRNREHWIQYVYSNQKFMADAHTTYFKYKGCWKSKYRGKRPCPLDSQDPQISEWLAGHKMARFDNDFWFKNTLGNFLKDLLLFPFALAGVTGEYLFSCGWKDTLEERESCGYIKNAVVDTPVEIERFQKAHDKWLSERWPFDITLSQNKFNQQPAINSTVRFKIRQKYTLNLPASWSINNRNLIYRYYDDQLKEQKELLKAKYKKESDYDLNIESPSKFQNKQQLFGYQTFQPYYENKLGRNYFPNFHPMDTALESYNQWKTQQVPSINIIKMVTTEITRGFALGGPFYQLGVDAVMYSVVPTLSIALSVLSVLLMLGKIFIIPLYHYIFATKRLSILFAKQEPVKALKYNLPHMLTSQPPNETAKKLLIKTSIIVVILLPFIAFLFIPVFKGTFFAGVNDFIEKSQKEETTLDAFKWGALGYTLDVEKFLYSQSPNRDIAKSDIVKKPNKPLRQIDDVLYPIAKMYINFAKPEKGIYSNDMHILLYQGDYDLVLSFGLNVDKNDIKSVNVPALFNDQDLELLANAKIFFRPNYQELFKISLMEKLVGTDLLLTLTDTENLNESLKQKFERHILEKLKQNKPVKKHILTEYSRLGPGSNLVFVKSKLSNKYRCYAMPPITLSNIAQLKQNKLIESKMECPWVL